MAIKSTNPIKREFSCHNGIVFPRAGLEMTEFADLREKAGLTISDLAELLGYGTSTIYRWDRGDVVPRRIVLERLRSLVMNRLLPLASPQFHFIDLFAGIGGMRLAFEKIGGRCVYTSEWDKYSQLTYRANFPHDDHEIAGDITKVKDLSTIARHDVLLAGFPCQPFSLAGVSKKNSLGRSHGFLDETQGTLFFEIARIIAHHKPRAFLLENVKNLKSHDRGRTFAVIKNVLEEELGYHVSTKLVDARCFVPQHRERIFIVGFREANDFSFDNLVLPTKEAHPALKSILHPEDGSEPFDDSTSEYIEEQSGRVRSDYFLSAHLWDYLQRYAEKHKQKGNGFGYGLVGPNDVARTLSARYHKDGSEILIRRRARQTPRRLTPRECSRLMGFDSPSRTFRIPVSDTQAYRQFGNAVVVPVVEAIASLMKPYLDAGKPRKNSKKQVTSLATSPGKKARELG